MKYLLIIFTLIVAGVYTIGIPAELDVERTGTIHGEVFLDESVPEPPQIRADRNVEVCGEVVSDNPLIVQNQRVQGTVISLDWQAGSMPQSNPADERPELALRGKHCRFDPRIQVASVGTRLIVGSKDPIAHNPHGWWNHSKTVFNLTVLNPSFSFRRTLKRPGIYRIDCDTHKWMKAYIHVFNHPFYGITDEKGRFIIPDVPVGQYTLRAWHEVLGEQTVVLDVKAGEKTECVFKFSLSDHRDAKYKPEYISPWPPSEDPGVRQE